MALVVKLPVPDKRVTAVIPDLINDAARGPCFTVATAAIRDLRAKGQVALIVPVHDADGAIDVAAHAFLRWSCDTLHASDELKNELNTRENLLAVHDYAQRLIGARHDITVAGGGEYGHPADADIGDHFDPRVLVVPDFKNDVIRLSRRFIDALRQGSRVIPVIAGGADDLDEDMAYAGATGILLPGSNSHYHPRHYGSAQDEDDTAYDLIRDALVKAAVEKAYAEDIPLFGICSGMQGIVLFGEARGRLIQDLHGAGRPGHQRGSKVERADFREAFSVLVSPQVVATGVKKKTGYFSAAHAIRLAPGSFLTHLLHITMKFRAGNQRTISHGFEVPVNSLHQQAIDESSIGSDLSIEAVADDGTVEAVHSRRHKYIVGVQFHPEAAFMRDVPVANALEDALYRALFWSFGQAASERLWLSQITRRGGGGNWRNRGMAWIYMRLPGSLRMTPEFVTGGGFSGTSYNLMPKLWD